MNDSDRAIESRVWVLGVAGSGKSTFAGLLAERLAVRHVELDALFWLPGWKTRPEENFAEVVGAMLAPTSWVVDGQYPGAVERFTSTADCVVWLDPPMRLSYPRLVRRTFGRLVHHTRFCGENYESIRSVFGRKSILWLAARYHREQRRKIRNILDTHSGPSALMVHYRDGDMVSLVEDLVGRLVTREMNGRTFRPPEPLTP